MSRHRLTLIFAIVGAGTLFGAGVTAVREGIMPTELLLLMLALPAAWLRIKLEPTGDISLVPVVIFVAFVSARPHVPLLVATLAAIVGTSLFSRRSSGEALQAAGEEAIPVWASIGLLRASVFAPLASRSWQIELVLAILTYAVVRLGIMSLRVWIREGMEFRSFLVTCGRSVLANLGFFALVALGLDYLTRGHGNAGYLTLALATIALVEAYHPYKLLSDQRDVLFASLAMIAQAIDLKDAYTGKHARDASEIAVKLARRLALPEPEVRKIRIAGMLHDIGKVAVSGRIIRKPSALEAEEMRTMRQHPVVGAEIMRPVELLKEAAEIVRHHHENFDGSGYPDGLRGEQIPMGSRIVFVADAFNAITTDRPYRKARSKKEALEIIRANSGRQFDPKAAAALESIIDLV